MAHLLPDRGHPLEHTAPTRCLRLQYGLAVLNYRNCRAPTAWDRPCCLRQGHGHAPDHTLKAQRWVRLHIQFEAGRRISGLERNVGLVTRANKKLEMDGPAT